MTSKTSRIARVIVLVSFALTSAAWAAPCSNASLNGTYGFLHDSTDDTGAPASAAVSQITFDPTTGTFSGQTTSSRGGVIGSQSLSGTYSIAPDCTGTGTPAAGSPFSIVVTAKGFLALHLFAEGFAVKQGPAVCTNAGLKGNYGFETTGSFVAGAPSTGAVAFIGQLNFDVSSGAGVITGSVSSSQGGTFAAGAAVTGSYQIGPDCTGTITITPNGLSPMDFNFVIVNQGKEVLLIQTDPSTIVSGTLVKDK